MTRSFSWIGWIVSGVVSCVSLWTSGDCELIKNRIENPTVAITRTTRPILKGTSRFSIRVMPSFPGTPRTRKVSEQQAISQGEFLMRHLFLLVGIGDIHTGYVKIPQVFSRQIYISHNAVPSSLFTLHVLMDLEELKVPFRMLIQALPTSCPSTGPAATSLTMPANPSSGNCSNPVGWRSTGMLSESPGNTACGLC